MSVSRLRREQDEKVKAKLSLMKDAIGIRFVRRGSDVTYMNVWYGNTDRGLSLARVDHCYIGGGPGSRLAEAVGSPRQWAPGLRETPIRSASGPTPPSLGYVREALRRVAATPSYSLRTEVEARAHRRGEDRTERTP